MNGRVPVGSDGKDPSIPGPDEEVPFRKKKLTSLSSSKAQKRAQRESARAFNRAAKMSGRAWRNPGVSQSIKDWEGEEDFASSGASQTMNIARRSGPEGATLRSW